jgi:beta-lactamase class A
MGIILTGAWFYTGWKSSQRMLPVGLSIGGLDVGGSTREQALEKLTKTYTDPITVYYREQKIILVPEMVELTLDIERTAENLDQVILAQGGVEGFIKYAIGRVRGEETEVQEIHPVLSYSRERIDSFLERVAQQHDHPPLEPVPLPEAETFRPPQPGTTLDIDASRPRLIQTLLSPVEDEVELVVEMEPIPPASMEFLREALDARLSNFTGIAGIFVKDLETGRELCYNCNVAYAAVSTLKIGIVPVLYRELDTAPDGEMAQYIRATLAESDNGATNQLLAEIGAGNPYSGAVEVTNFLQELGMNNTFMAVPYDMKEGIADPNIQTPANSRTDLNTEPDPYIQTTPLEMGLLLEGLVQCVKDGGNLRLLYPESLTPQECQTTLSLLEQNEINTLLRAGMPEGTRMAHKHGWTGDTHADVAVVYSADATFILSVFLYQPEWLVWEESAPTFADIGQLTYRFFNPNTPLTEDIQP